MADQCLLTDNLELPARLTTRLAQLALLPWPVVSTCALGICCCYPLNCYCFKVRILIECEFGKILLLCLEKVDHKFKILIMQNHACVDCILQEIFPNLFNDILFCVGCCLQVLESEGSESKMVQKALEAYVGGEDGTGSTVCLLYLDCWDMH